MLKTRLTIKRLLFLILILLSGCISDQQVKRVERAYGSPMDCNGDLQVTQEIIVYDKNGKTEPPKIESRCQTKNNVPESEFDKNLKRRVKEHK